MCSLVKFKKLINGGGGHNKLGGLQKSRKNKRFPPAYFEPESREVGKDIAQQQQQQQQQQKLNFVFCLHSYINNTFTILFRACLNQATGQLFNFRAVPCSLQKRET